MRLQIKKKEIKAELCEGLSSVIGFMFHFSPHHAKVLSFKEEKKISLHMLFVFFPLLAIFLDSRKKVVDTKKLKPFTFYTSPKKAKYVVEIPLSLVSGLRLSIGDKIKFIS